VGNKPFEEDRKLPVKKEMESEKGILATDQGAGCNLSLGS
jgi:hypothetical protein